MELYEIAGSEGTVVRGIVFGLFTSEVLAKEGMEHIGEDLAGKVEIRKSGLKVNTMKAGSKVIDITAGRSAEEIIASRDENNYVEGYIQIHISDLIHNDHEGFLSVISEELVGSDLLMDVNYNAVGIADTNELILKVTGDVSLILDMGGE